MDRKIIIDRLKDEVVKTFGDKVSTTNDFIELRNSIFEKCNTYISESTLKRIWGYVNDSRTTRDKTLDILAKYCGYSDFNDFEDMVSSKKIDFDKYQLAQFETIERLFKSAKQCIRFKMNPKYCGNIDVVKDGIKIYNPIQTRLPFIRYRDVLDYKYIVRTMDGSGVDLGNNISLVYDKEDPVIVQYDSLEDLILDGWEVD